MRRFGFSLVAAGVVGFAASGEASACHKKKAVECAPAPVAVACEAPAPKKHHFKMKMPKLGCHKKKAAECAPVAVCYEAPMMAYTAATPQGYATPQAMPDSQMMPPVPGK